MGVITKEVEIRLTPSTYKHYEELGYKIPTKKATEKQQKRHKKEYMYDFETPILVKTEDLTNGCHAIVEVLCDMCQEEIISVSYEVYNRVVKKTGNYVCRDCSYEKTRQTNQKIYGTKFPSQLEEIKEKIKETNLERYGVEYYAKTKECCEKIRQTCIEKYGVEHFAQSQQIKDKKATTNLERYGVEYISQVYKFKEKQRQSLFKHYGVENPMHSEELKQRLVNTMYKNGSQKSSKQQRYLHNIYSGELNYPIKYFDVDICLLDEKITIEYDGSGHNLPVKFNKMTQEEFDQREIMRFNVLKREGYKQMRIISRKDLLPSDEILLQMLSIAREYFSTTNHSWINFDIDNSIMINVKNKDTNGIFFDYGKLRKIKESA